MQNPANLNEGQAQMNLTFSVDKKNDQQMIEKVGLASAAIGKKQLRLTLVEIQPPNSLLTLQITMKFE
jgi:hypothetical protein